MKKIFLPNTSIFSLIGLLCLASCSSEYQVDFRNISFPGNSKLNKKERDLILEREEKQVYRKPDDSLFVKTDRKIYRVGEKIVLKIVNNSARTEYFYESNENTQEQMEAFPDFEQRGLKDFRKELVSEDPAIVSAIVYADPCLVNVYLGGVNNLLAEKLGLEGFDTPLEPGETMVFKVTMPKRAGNYRFRLIRYSHGSFGFWGANREIVSNVFEIVKN